MSELLELAEHYYAVARDLEEQGKKFSYTAEFLYKCADKICEAQISQGVQEPSQEKKP